MRITLRQLAVFEAVVRAGSIAKAAQEVGLSQSAASMSLKDLEAHLGVELFARQGKRLLLSDRGRQMREKAKSVLLMVSELEALTTPEELRGRLRIGAAPSVGNYVLPELCAEFMRRYPGVQIELRVGASYEVMERVQKMFLDIGFVGAPVNSSYLEALPWLRDSLVICCAPSNPLAGLKQISLVGLKDQAWVLEKTTSSERVAFTTEMLKYINSIHIALETDSIEAIKRVVRGSNAIGCLSRSTVKNEVERGELVILEVPELDFTRIYSLITRRGIYQKLAHQAFQNFALEQCALEQYAKAGEAW